MSLEAAGALTIFRHLPKAIRKHIGVDGSKAHFKSYVSGEFHKNLNLNDPEITKYKLKLARDYSYLVSSVQHHKDLLFSYNVGVDRTDEMKRTLSKSAASVGLRLPDVYQS